MIIMLNNSFFIYSYVKIYSSVFSSAFNLENKIFEFLQTLVKTTFKLIKLVQRSFRTSFSNPHYIFGVSNMKAIMQQFIVCDGKNLENNDSIIKMWAHECFREVGDRLTYSHYLKFESMFQNLLAVDLGLPHDLRSSTEEIFFCNEVMWDDRSYTVFQNLSKISSRVAEIINENETGFTFKKIPVTPYYLNLLIKMKRVVEMNDRNIILLGNFSSGKKTLLQILASLLNIMYREVMFLFSDFKNCIKSIFETAILDNKRVLCAVPWTHEDAKQAILIVSSKL